MSSSKPKIPAANYELLEADFNSAVKCPYDKLDECLAVVRDGISLAEFLKEPAPIIPDLTQELIIDGYDQKTSEPESSIRLSGTFRPAEPLLDPELEKQLKDISEIPNIPD